MYTSFDECRKLLAAGGLHVISMTSHYFSEIVDTVSEVSSSVLHSIL
jgi:hypothetical protein